MNGRDTNSWARLGLGSWVSVLSSRSNSKLCSITLYSFEKRWVQRCRPCHLPCHVMLYFTRPVDFFGTGGRATLVVFHPIHTMMLDAAHDGTTPKTPENDYWVYLCARHTRRHDWLNSSVRVYTKKGRNTILWSLFPLLQLSNYYLPHL